MKEIIFLEPIFKENIWGGNRLATDFGYNIPYEHTGECWAIAAHPNGESVVKSGTYKGKGLQNLWKENRELFGNMEGDCFPLLIKIIDAQDDLSIQVHPDDSYARENENGSLGKTECWCVLDCKQDGTIVIGHNAKDKQELKEMIEQKRWSDFIREIPVQKGDFFQIDPGCLHAIKGGTLILETQQNSDVTYRVYDYDRLSGGKPRDLHVKQSIDVINAPFKPQSQTRETVTEDGITRQKLIECKYYTVEKIDISGSGIISQDHKFMNVSVIDGSGFADGVKIEKGYHFIVPYKYGQLKFDGNLQMIISYI